MYDIIIIGGGPAGLTAAVYGLRNGKSVFIIEKSVFGGQIVNSPKVENIPGFDSISGDDFADKFLDQAMKQGAQMTLEEVTSVEKTGDSFSVKTLEGGTYEGRTIILATGTTHRLLGLPGEEELIGSGIATALMFHLYHCIDVELDIGEVKAGAHSKWNAMIRLAIEIWRSWDVVSYRSG